MDSLKKIREQIDNIDQRLVNLLNQRANITADIGKKKHKKGLSIFASDRERAVYEKILKTNKGPLTEDSLKSIYREIMSASLSLEKPLKIAFLGPAATFTNLAAIKKFGNSLTYIPCDSIADVFVSVEKNTADYGVVPIENSIEGAVNHTLDMLVDSSMLICSEVYLEISHNLMAKCSKKQIHDVYSNPQVFGQCRGWIECNLPGVGLIEVASTSKAAQIAAKRKNAACIASLLAAKQYNLKVLAKGIEDIAHNVTRFLVIGKAMPSITGRDKTSLVFSVKDRVGVLHDMLVPFKKYKINLTKIESRPSKKKPWKYYFFIDLEGHCQNPKVKKALDALEKHCRFLKVLGSYPEFKEI